MSVANLIHVSHTTKHRIFLCYVYIAVLLFSLNTTCEARRKHKTDYYRDGNYYKTYQGLTVIPTDIPAEAKKVSLNWNMFSDIRPGAFSHLTECELLWIIEANVMTIRPDMWGGLDSLEELYLTENYIQDIPNGTFAYLTKLKRLGISANRLDALRADMWQGLESLEYLGLAGNKLTVIEEGMLDGLPALKELWLFENQIHTIRPGAFSSLGNLERLQLFSNSLRSVRGDMWEGLVSLNYLNYRMNLVTKLEQGDLANLPNISQALFEENKITTVAEGLFSPQPRKVFLGLYGNTLHCDSKMCWMKQAAEESWLKTDQTGVPSPSCSNLNGEYFLWVTSSQLGCES